MLIDTKIAEGCKYYVNGYCCLQGNGCCVVMAQFYELVECSDFENGDS